MNPPYFRCSYCLENFQDVSECERHECLHLPRPLFKPTPVFSHDACQARIQELESKLAEANRDHARDQQELARCWNAERLGLEARIHSLTQALEFYANTQHYVAGSAKLEGHISKVEADNWGNRARRALSYSK